MSLAGLYSVLCRLQRQNAHHAARPCLDWHLSAARLRNQRLSSAIVLLLEFYRNRVAPCHPYTPRPRLSGSSTIKCFDDALVPHQYPSLLRFPFELPPMFYTFAHPRRAVLVITATCLVAHALPFSSNPSTASVDLRRELEESSFRKLPMQLPRGDLAAELYVTIACA